ncbi:transcriptional regulator, GntR family domain protein [Paraburkholderia fungorum]|jgi:hypothetical protein|uniref:Transcriptional regulator, GntR family domain protein n=1 Tax=Paraburkholderia fungorum TaxID=134537 RepID=A0AAW3USP9_9BURK|nr:transcriptional regulator, GntR family domain protein [Paraburkholderia fungorum]MBB4512672.1 hypothetical protein [Paraburkholderia fungorum]MBB5539730.1 hypothetical protein [Paraburkholderia fungorum]MBB6200577.1 hypothetical protein [Paraburkholderia fungorum]PRZ45819.1 hypothetical protein BX589_1363 [Paraburkholderia fungorum]
MIRQLIEFCNDTPQAEQERFSQANARIHKAIINAVREHDVEKVPDRMIVQMTEAPRYVKRMKCGQRGRPILDSEIR